MALEKMLQQARDTPGKLAAVQDGKRYDYGHLARWITRVRNRLQDDGVPATGVAVICVDRNIDAWVAGLALRSLGLTTIVALSADHIEQLGLPRIACIVGMETEKRPVLDARAALRGWRLLKIPAMDEKESASGPLPVSSLGTPGGHIMITSGTTGSYKKVLRDAAAESSLVPLHADINAINADSVVYASNFGLWSAGGYRWPLITWSMGGTVVFHQNDDLDRPLREHAMTHLFATPSLLSELLGKLPEDFQRTDAMRLMVTAGAMPSALVASARQRLTRQVYSVLASTEALTIAVTPLEDEQDLHWHRIHPARNVQVVDEAHHPLPPGSVGHVRIRVLDGLQGYLHDEAATAMFFRDGWFYPGDMGVLAEDGRLCLHGRMADVVNILGTKMATGKMERLFQDRLGASAVCVLMLLAGEGDEELHVVVETRGSLGREQCEAALSSELRALAGMHVHFDLIDAMPRNAMGKVLRQELRRRLLEDRARQVP